MVRSEVYVVLPSEYRDMHFDQLIDRLLRIVQLWVAGRLVRIAVVECVEAIL